MSCYSDTGFLVSLHSEDANSKLTEAARLNVLALLPRLPEITA